MSAIRRRWIPALVLVALVALAAGAALALRPEGTDSPSATASTSAAPTSAPDGTAAAAATSTAPYTLKPEPTFVATDEQRPSDDGLVVVLTYAGFESASGTVEANGYVAGTIVEGDTCTLTLTQGDRRVTATSTTIANATTTSCGLLEAGPDLAAGTWEAVLSYKGTESAAMEVTVP